MEAFDPLLDPKAAWALRHLDRFPVEVNRADYEMLLRVPGIGVRSARRIVRARRTGPLGFDELRQLGIVLKRAKYFLTARGRFLAKNEPTTASLRQLLLAAGTTAATIPRQLELFPSVPETSEPRQPIGEGEF